MTFNEGDIVEVRGKPVSSEAVPVGAQGEIIHVYKGGICYEVLFRRQNGRTLTTAAVTSENLRLVKRLEQTA